MARVLVVDDEPKLGRVVAQMLELDGHAVVRADGGREAVARLDEESFDVVVTDLRMPEVDGLAVLRAARARTAVPEVVLMTAYGTAESAVEAMKSGAADYVTKPFSMDELRLRVTRLASQRTAEYQRSRLVARLTPDLVAESAAMKAVLAAARQVAPTDASVLLLGESGTGKSQLARWIHYQGRRAPAPFVEVHCAALPETLLEAELFGHEKGAFTGATQRKAGHLAAADGGTLFLDEIGEIAPATQVKLLRFLQDRTFVSVGATEPRTVDVRVISATNRDLDEAVRSKAFREDFYYRLNVSRSACLRSGTGARTCGPSRSGSSPPAESRWRSCRPRHRITSSRTTGPGTCASSRTRSSARSSSPATPRSARRISRSEPPREAVPATPPSSSARASPSTRSSASSCSPRSCGLAATRRARPHFSASRAGGSTRCSRRRADHRTSRRRRSGEFR